jgi:cell division protein FtsI (penicillin-binding protein 3)
MEDRRNRNRVYLFLALCLALFGAAAMRQVWLAFGLGRSLPTAGTPREERASIYDRHGRPLALSLERYHVYLNTRKAIGERGASNLMAVLGVEEGELHRLRSEPKTWLLRKFVDRERAERLRRVRSDAVLVERVWLRQYPQGKLLSHALGYTGFDGSGLAGLERQYNETLSGKGGGGGHADLILSVDNELQYAAERALERGVAKHQADGGCLLVQDPHSGRILAMAACPDFDPNRYAAFDEVVRRNPAVSDPVEPGSIFKVFFIGALLDRYQIDFDKPYFYSDRQYLLENGEAIQDAKAYGWVSFREVVKHSINAGIIQACQELTRKDRHDFLVRAHFAAPTGVDLPGEHRGILRPTRDWGVRTTATILIGQGLAVTPIQLISSFSALVNGGVWMRPQLVDRTAWRDDRGVHTQANEIRSGNRIVSAASSARTTSLLTWGTAPGSTGELARQSGYDGIPAKTGTSQMVNLERGGYYSNRFNALFIAAFPERDPRVTALVILFNPREGHTGGLAAAPVFAELLPDLVRTMKLPLPRDAAELGNRLLTLARTTPTASPERVPDLVGLSARESRIAVEGWSRALAAGGNTVHAVFEGSGYVRRQHPPAGSPSMKSNQIQVILGAP